MRAPNRIVVLQLGTDEDEATAIQSARGPTRVM